MKKDRLIIFGFMTPKYSDHLNSDDIRLEFVDPVSLEDTGNAVIRRTNFFTETNSNNNYLSLSTATQRTERI